MTAPRVTVLMPVHNGAAYIDAAIASILGQSFTDFELLIVDDGSADATPAIIAAHAQRDARIRILTNPHNQRLVASLNRGLREARAPLIARMDADDIAHAERLALQVAFLDAHPDHLLVGTGYRHMNQDGKILGPRPNPMDWRCAAWVARFRTPMIHPGFCFRRDLPSGERLQYDNAFPRAEDYALAARLMQHGRIAVLPQLLVDFRSHAANIRSSQTAAMQADGRRVSAAALAAHYPPQLCERLGAVLDPLYLLRAPTLADIGDGAAALEAVIALDSGNHAEARWMRRRAGGFLAEATIGRARGLKRWAMAAHFAIAAPRFVLPMLARMAENRGLIRPANTYAEDPAEILRQSQPAT